MSREITKSSELNNYTLRHRDIVIFKLTDKKILKYAVRTCYLICESEPYMNETIFYHLELNRNDFCEKMYGYKVYGGGFPESKNEDYEALTRAAKQLLFLLEKKRGIHKPTALLKVLK